MDRKGNRRRGPRLGSRAFARFVFRRFVHIRLTIADVPILIRPAGLFILRTGETALGVFADGIFTRFSKYFRTSRSRYIRPVSPVPLQPRQKQRVKHDLTIRSSIGGTKIEKTIPYRAIPRVHSTLRSVWYITRKYGENRLRVIDAPNVDGRWARDGLPKRNRFRAAKPTGRRRITSKISESETIINDSRATNSRYVFIVLGGVLGNSTDSLKRPGYLKWKFRGVTRVRIYRGGRFDKTISPRPFTSISRCRRRLSFVSSKIARPRRF